MIDELKFVQGAVGKTDMLAQMTHFCIENRQIRATNGRITIGAPIACDLTVKPKADKFVAAITQAEGTVSLTVNQAGKLVVKSGRMNVRIDCLTEDFHYPRPDGIARQIDGQGLRKALDTLRPLVAERRAPQEWAKGVLLRGASAFATNGHAVGQYWIGTEFPGEVVIPLDTVAEILRIKEAPKHVQIDNSSMTFHYEGMKWVRTALLAARWPENSAIEAMFAKERGNYVPIPKEAFETAKKLKKYIEDDGFFYMDRGEFRSHLGGDEGATIAIDFAPGLFRLKLQDFLDMEEYATEMEFNEWGNNVPLYLRGGMFRGAVQTVNPNF
ncbi:putative replicative clamp [Stenotrophomonas phage BUCT627]|uniref:Replicative clamp n=2 Tax=Bixiavirus TaxID=3044676 RepID=A0AC61N9Z3_9CAUD|nr:putative replicative clamp [Stenotrophomonas phage vB_SmaS_BUCT548]YP_010677472.1 putative replicative clamp [Stenotrophomonas phage BUCT627]QIQ60758.1 putative replicative clamp [Stenotrophomonas phage vB_SmaS_BUCT548]QYC96672.1 putative replicative clamp [Stenotrophomonas phage BUCT627]WFG37985.1 DNA polymerase processivity factor [Pseudomonas phage 20Sep420]